MHHHDFTRWFPLLMSFGVIVAGISGCGEVHEPPIAPRGLPTTLESSRPAGEAQFESVQNVEGRLATNEPVAAQGFPNESYAEIVENRYLTALENPLSTFSIDVDTASYANVRRFLSNQVLPPADSVRIEELINYFPYDYEPPEDGHPFATHIEVARCPWNPDHHLARVAIKGRELSTDQRPATNLVFLLDVSGSMNAPNKLPLLKSSLRLLLEQLTAKDRVAIVVYAGSAGVVLNSTTADHQRQILAAINQLQAGGSTNGGQGIELAYQIARQNFIPAGTNRVILCSDGDFNVGNFREKDLFQGIEEKARSGIFLTVIGFGMGNFKDSMMEGLADKGNGNYAYIDTINEARKVFVDQLSGTLVTIAKDVKIQIEFNPARVGTYRLIGYENRILTARDFNDDRKDAGEIGAGHTITALYELVPPSGLRQLEGVDPLKYQRPVHSSAIKRDDVEIIDNGELFTLKLRYKFPDEDRSQRIVMPCFDDPDNSEIGSEDFRWAAAVAAFGMVLRNSAHRGNANYAAVYEMAMASRGRDFDGYRGEFLELIEQARRLSRQ